MDEDVWHEDESSQSHLFKEVVEIWGQCFCVGKEDGINLRNNCAPGLPIQLWRLSLDRKGGQQQQGGWTQQPQQYKCGNCTRAITHAEIQSNQYRQDTNGRRANVLFENVLVIDNGWATRRGHNIDFEYDDSFDPARLVSVTGPGAQISFASVSIRSTAV